MGLGSQQDLSVLTRVLKGLVLQREKEADFLLVEFPCLCVVLELCLLEK